MTIKTAQTATPIHDLLAQRWSPRAFDPQRLLTSDQILALCEAARWAPSSSNEQPWRMVLCDRAHDESSWRAALSVLNEKNQLWARNAPLLVAVTADSLSTRNNTPNRWAQYDAGAAAVSLCLQATALGLAAHQMGGFDSDKARAAFGIPERYVPMAMIAVGYSGALEQLDAQFHASETSARTRQLLASRFFFGRWGPSAQ